MKKNNLFKTILLSTVVILSSCSKNSDDDVTLVGCTVENTPMSYVFTNDGNNTVYFGGQSNRLATAKAVYDMLNAGKGSATAVTSADITTAIDNANSKLLTKTAENDPNRTHIIEQLNSILDGYAAISSTLADTNIVASAGQAGWKGSYQLDARGWELDQLYAKMLIGALCLEQNAYDYLTKINIIDENNNRGYDGDDTYYTKAEHYWDEAFGYTYGMDGDITVPEISGCNFLGKYLTKHNGIDYSQNNWKQDAYDAYKLGRQAIVENCQDEIDRQITVINTTLSNVVAWHAADYLKKSAEQMGTDKFFHSVSEAWGFVMSLQFTKMANGMPLFSHSEVNNMLTTLDAGTNGAWDLEATTLTDMAAQIEAAMAAANN